jgi:uncharacterized protein YbcI
MLAARGRPLLAVTILDFGGGAWQRQEGIAWICGDESPTESTEMNERYPESDDPVLTSGPGQLSGPAPDSAVVPRSPMLEIANALVRLYKEAFGRGPTKARAVMAGPDALVVILENSLTVAERNLANLGQHDRVRETRLLVQRSLDHEFRAAVEEILGRRVIVFVGAMDTGRDVSVEFFTLESQHDGSVVPS